jgi:hypothetical protein
LKPGIVILNAKHQIDFGKEVYHDNFQKKGIRTHFEYYLSQKKERENKHFFCGIHLDYFHAERQINCIRKVDKVYTRFEKRKGLLLGFGSDLGFTMMINSFSLEPSIGFGGTAEIMGSLHSKNDNYSNTMIDASAFFFSYQHGLSF